MLPATAKPFIPGIVRAIHEALAQAIAGSFWIGLVVAVVAVMATLCLREIPLRTTHQDRPDTRATPDLAPEPAPEELVSAG